MPLKWIMSGGQTGVDRAALDAALAQGIACGGWCPRGRKAEDGPIPPEYPVLETRSTSYAVRTRWNVRDSDATLILTRGTPSGGTALTVSLARRMQRPVLIQQLGRTSPHRLHHVRDWLQLHHVRRLNIAGPRESSSPGIYELARTFLDALLTDVTARQRLVKPAPRGPSPPGEK